MIKIYLCKVKTNKISFPLVSKKNGYFTNGEKFLMYSSPKKAWNTTMPYNSTSNDTLFSFDQFQTRLFSYRINFDNTNILEVMYAKNKKELGEIIESFYKNRNN